MPRAFLNALLIDTSPTYRGAGISHYQQRLIEAMAQVTGAWELTAVVDDRAWRPPEPVRVFRPHWTTRNPLARVLWEQTLQALLVYQLRPDVYHGLAYVAPLFAPVAHVVTVHDLSFVHFPETFPPWKARYLRWFTRASLRRAARVITVSESTRQDVLRWLALPPERVVTVHNGVDPSFQPLSPAEVHRWRAARGLPERFILYLGTLQPRKNLATLVRAYHLWRQQASSDQRDVVLILAGAKGWFAEPLFALVEALDLTPWVYFPGYIPRQELVYWYNAATVFAYPSRFEGFGLPVLEAMACGCAVVAARASSLPEIVGDAGLLVPPDDVEGWCNALAELLGNETRRQDLGQRARRRSLGFSWERAARETLAVYEEVRGCLL